MAESEESSRPFEIHSISPDEGDEAKVGDSKNTNEKQGVSFSHASSPAQTPLQVPNSIPRITSIPYLASSARKAVMHHRDDVFGAHKVIPHVTTENAVRLLLPSRSTSRYGSIISSNMKRVDLPLVEATSTPQGALSPHPPSPIDFPSRCISVAKRLFRRDNTALFVVSALATILLIAVDQIWIGLQDVWMAAMVGYEDIDGDYHPRLFWGKFFASAFRVALVIAAVTVTQKIAPEAAGSGIPQLKAVLAGEVKLDAFLSLRCFVGKIIGTSLALGAGIPIGREGPFIHLAAGLAAVIRKQCFKSAISKRRLLCAGAAVGIAACMGTAIGGTLFSIEVTSITFVVSYYWSTFSSAICAFVINAFLQQELKALGIVPLFSTKFKEVEMGEFTILDLACMALLAFMCGLLGPLFVTLHAEWVKARRKIRAAALQTCCSVFCSKVIFAGIVATVYMMVCWSVGGPLLYPERLVADDLVNPGNMPHYWNAGYGEELHLLLYAVIYFFFTIAFVTLKLPAGIFAPMFVTGAALGRLMALLLSRILGPLGTARVACFALLGGAGLTSSVTQTFSAGLIAYGLTGMEGLLLPVLLVTLISCGIAMQLSHNIYDNSCLLKHIPLLLVPSSHQSLRIYAKDLMEDICDNYVVDSEPIKVSELTALLHAVKSQSPIPVIHSEGHPLLVGSIPHQMLAVLIEACKVAGRQEVSMRDKDVVPLIDQCPLVLNKDANLQKIAFLFHTLRAEYAFVVDMGQAVGIVTRRHLIEFQEDHSHLY